jgi:hypothetical protein
MKALLEQAFSRIDNLGARVAKGEYDLVGPTGEIILPQVWETILEPDWAISMHMWPMQEVPGPASPGSNPKDGMDKQDGGVFARPTKLKEITTTQSAPRAPEVPTRPSGQVKNEDKVPTGVILVDSSMSEKPRKRSTKPSKGSMLEQFLTGGKYGSRTGLKR